MAALEAAASQHIVESEAGSGGAWRQFAHGTTVPERIAMLERLTISSVYNMQRHVKFDPQRRERAPNRHTRERGLQGHLIMPNQPYLSLLASCHPDTWVGPAFMQALAVDERLVLFGGPLNPAGQKTVWVCTAHDVIDDFCHLWAQAKHRSVPIWDVDGVTALSERQLEVACLLIAGATDARVARALGVSGRTVAGDVSQLCDALQVGSRLALGFALGTLCS